MEGRWIEASTSRKGCGTLGKQVEQLGKQELRAFVEEVLDKRQGVNKKSWYEILDDFDLDCSPDLIRKISTGIKIAYDAGMDFNVRNQSFENQKFIERQKIYDMQRNIRKDMREFSRTELICEHIAEAIKELPKIEIKNDIDMDVNFNTRRDLVVGIGDFHYGADYNVKGLYGEELNKYDTHVFEKRMAMLMNYIVQICTKENPEQVTIMIVGDMLDGMLRASQLQRLEYGVIESTMKLAELLTVWISDLANIINLPIRVYAVRGNHGEIRPLGTKAGQFPEENMERIIMHYLFARFQGIKSVKIAQNDAPMMQMVDVCGYQFLLLHGQNTNIEAMAKDYINLYNKHIDVFMVGHLHKSQTFISGILPEGNIYVERIPSLCGVDPYAQSKGYSASAGATIILMEEGYGRRCVYPIILK